MDADYLQSIAVMVLSKCAFILFFDTCESTKKILLRECNRFKFFLVYFSK